MTARGQAIGGDLDVGFTGVQDEKSRNVFVAWKPIKRADALRPRYHGSENSAETSGTVLGKTLLDDAVELLCKEAMAVIVPKLLDSSWSSSR